MAKEMVCSKCGESDWFMGVQLEVSDIFKITLENNHITEIQIDYYEDLPTIKLRNIVRGSELLYCGNCDKEIPMDQLINDIY